MTTQTYSIQEAADLLGVSAMTIARRVDDGEIPAILVGRRRLVPRRYIAELFADSGYPLGDGEEAKLAANQ